jgi:hypothetical protein
MQKYKIFEACDGSFGKAKSLNKNVVFIETYPEVKCILERRIVEI